MENLAFHVDFARDNLRKLLFSYTVWAQLKGGKPHETPGLRARPHGDALWPRVMEPAPGNNRPPVPPPPIWVRASWAATRLDEEETPGQAEGPRAHRRVIIKAKITEVRREKAKASPRPQASPLAPIVHRCSVDPSRPFSAHRRTGIP